MFQVHRAMLALALAGTFGCAEAAPPVPPQAAPTTAQSPEPGDVRPGKAPEPGDVRPGVTTLADGKSGCTSGAQCQSGTCEGQGCGDETPGTCVPRERRCTRDLVSYCGCDGKTFETSGSCPGRRYAKRGACN